MLKSLLIFVASSFLYTPLLSQKDKTKTSPGSEELKQIIETIGFDSTVMLAEVARLSCNCIDSARKIEIAHSKKLIAFAGCIDEQVSGYQLSMKLLSSMKSNSKQITISVTDDKNSDEYKKYYYRIERWLKDSCAVLNTSINSNDEANEKSYSKNAAANTAYYEGVEHLKKKDFAGGVPFFEKAVQIDPDFVFAWDNLGVCYRNIDNFIKAELAYKASLKLDPAGSTALQNLPIVYLKQGKIDEAITGYKNILYHHPGNPEVYYGIGIAYYQYKKDMEQALHNMCKAYNIYVETKSPFRADAEKVINLIYSELKTEGKEELFQKILKEHKIKSN